MEREWPNLEIVNSNIFDTDNHPVPFGESFSANIELALGEIPAQSIGIEVVLFKRNKKDELEVRLVKELELASKEGHKAAFGGEVKPVDSGVLEYGIRIFPKHPLLPHRQDLNLVQWV